MFVHLDHTIVWSSDKARSAQFLADLLGLTVGPQTGPFLPVQLDGGTTLDYADAGPAELRPQHYAFRVDDARFDAALHLVVARGVPYAADPAHQRVGSVYHGSRGERGFYVHDPDGHNMELLTVPR